MMPDIGLSGRRGKLREASLWYHWTREAKHKMNPVNCYGSLTIRLGIMDLPR